MAKVWPMHSEECESDHLNQPAAVVRYAIGNIRKRYKGNETKRIM